ncbi:MAG TPA: glutathione synthase [Alphaproteobacteria bacterium]|nr:glutathione synthase [Alphaproteobacteria bacterium]HBF96965.1 glutathione synthase [Alphaproteobacteria bacterium]
MTLKVAIQMDPVSGIDIDGDSSFALALEAQARGHALFYYLPAHLSLRENAVIAKGHALSVRREAGNHFSLGAREMVNLREFDTVLMRQDPPFDMGYITATHILEHIHPDTLVVNDPAHVRNAPEKLLVTNFPELMPPTLITNDREEVRDFRARHRDIIIKPLYGNGGEGVFRVTPEDENLNSLMDVFSQFYREPMIVQKYLPDVRRGDKRIILVDGEAVGAINRVPAKGETRSNMHVGGRPEPTELTARDREICDAIGPTLKRNGLIFVGIDVIGTYLTEINVTSPTGIQEVRRFGGADIAALIWDAIESRR